MSSNIRDLLRTLAPETQGADNEVLDIFIELAILRVHPDVYGSVYRFAVAYLAAHMFVVTQLREGVTGPITSRRAGEVSLSYGRTNLMPQELNSTTYGNQFLQLRQGRPKIKPSSTFFER